MNARERLRGAGGGWIAIPRAVASDPTLSPAAKLVYGTLLDHLGKNSECWPAIRTLAKETGTSIGAVHRAYRQLLTAGLLTVSPGGRHNPNRYTFPNPKLCSARGTSGVPPMEHQLYPKLNTNPPETTQNPQPPQERAQNGTPVFQNRPFGVPPVEHNLRMEPLKEPPNSRTGAREELRSEPPESGLRPPVVNPRPSPPQRALSPEDKAVFEGIACFEAEDLPNFKAIAVQQAPEHLRAHLSQADPFTDLDLAQRMLSAFSADTHSRLLKSRPINGSR